MLIKITGIITDIFPAEIYGSFEKRIAWIDEVSGDRYPNSYALEFWQGDANLLDHVSPGDTVDCKVDVKGKKWAKNGKSGVINSLKCFEIIRKAGGPKFVPSTRNQTGGIPPKESPSGHPDKWQAPKQSKLDDPDPF